MRNKLAAKAESTSHANPVGTGEDQGETSDQIDGQSGDPTVNQQADSSTDNERADEPSELALSNLIAELNDILNDDDLRNLASETMRCPVTVRIGSLPSKPRIERNREIFDNAFESVVSRSSADRRIRFHRDHNEIEIYTWGETECVLPRGSTSTTLANPVRRFGTHTRWQQGV